jgi:hypothetical protein
MHRQFRGVTVRRSPIAPVREGRKRGSLSSPFTTSMIDTLGCSFAALLYLSLVLSAASDSQEGETISEVEPLSGGALAASGTGKSVPPLFVEMSNTLSEALEIPSDMPRIIFDQRTTIFVSEKQLLKGAQVSLKIGHVRFNPGRSL